jgi:hypothetical protein
MVAAKDAKENPFWKHAIQGHIRIKCISTNHQLAIIFMTPLAAPKLQPYGINF